LGGAWICCFLLTSRYSKHFEKAGQTDDLNEAIRAGTMDLDVSGGHASRPQLLHVIGFRYFDRYQSSGSLTYFEKAMGCIKQSLEQLDKTVGLANIRHQSCSTALHPLSVAPEHWSSWIWSSTLLLMRLKHRRAGKSI
jgi:hypothetical protein